MFALAAAILVFVVVTQLPNNRTPPPGAKAGQSGKQNGISYASWFAEEYSRPDADLALANLASTGANWVSLIAGAYQQTISSTTIYTTTDTPTDADLVHAINQAHRLGLKVMLKPHLDPIDDPGAWRGMIEQGFTSDREWAAWVASYKAFILRFADLAQAHGVEQFCVGAELLATAQRETEWREVIALVRDRYKGLLTFAADIDREVAKITWWDALDFTGVDAYPSTEKNNPSLAELKEALSSNTSIYVSWNSDDS